MVFLGTILYGLSLVLDKSLYLIAFVIERIGDLIKALFKLLWSGFFTSSFFRLYPLLSIGIILALLLFTPLSLSLIILIGLIPWFGSILVKLIYYLRNTLSIYLFEKAEYYRQGREPRFKSLKDYSNDYFKRKKEAERKAREAYYQEQRRRMEEEINDFFESMFNDFTSSNYGFGSENYKDYRRSSSMDSFKIEYEKSCRILGLDFHVNHKQVKAKYRELAKKYHPDLNPSPDATIRFQEINRAYQFLTEENIDLYNRKFNGGS